MEATNAIILATAWLQRIAFGSWFALRPNLISFKFAFDVEVEMRTRNGTERNGDPEDNHRQDRCRYSGRA